MRPYDMPYNLGLEFAGEVEADFGEVGLGHLEDVVGVGEEYVSAFAVDCHKLMFAALEGFEGIGIVALYPACFVK